MLQKSDSNSKKADTPSVTQAINEHNAASILERSAWSASPSSHSPRSQPEFAELPERYPADPDFQLRGTFHNPMIDAAMPLFGLVMRLRTLDDLPNILEVHQQVRTQVDHIVEEMRQRGYEAAQLLAYSYALCLYLDEAVNALLRQICTLIREVRGPVPEQVCAPLANVAPSNVRMRRQWPWWSPLLISAAAMAVVYGIYSYRLQLLTAEVLESLNHILQQ
ncbi:DotU family type IV/VI secretion system protein [Pseudomonas putida]|uniref:DotU family type IV/VI secretion system protein n=1 Tax=Pseudomonas putida TaxID=303 RepID=UPI0018D72057|nr:DotU family type IV/VI secretion system protein [Pseudomonas putida]MBH3413662.1 DotU family type IV/VI secretion system protein [Pseudomonas putida]